MKSPTTYRLDTTQIVTISGSSAATTNAVGANTHHVRIVSTTARHYVTGKTPTATTSNPYLPADVVEYVDITPGEKVAFLQHAAGGTGYVTEVTK